MSILNRLLAKNEDAKEATPNPAAGNTASILPSPLPSNFLGTVVTDRRGQRRRNARKGSKAVVIDDSSTGVAALRAILNSVGFSVKDAADAEAGLALIREEPPDLIFLDIVLPNMNGFSALRVIRKSPATKHIPVIMITGNEHAAEEFFARRIGADDFMKKPFSRAEVFARIEAMLDTNRVPRRKLVSDASPTKE